MFTEIIFEKIAAPVKEMLIAQMSSFATGFEEGDDFLKVIIENEHYHAQQVNDIALGHNLNFGINKIEQQNWNSLWESNFEPVLVDDFVAVRAGFHTPVTHTQHEIIITPKMSFGTGHHATTWLVMQKMRDIDFKGKRVFDFGTGTGILAILASKLGASFVLATDIDDWCIENAKENFSNNHINNIALKKSAGANQEQIFDIIIANINRNVLLEFIPVLARQTKMGSNIILSGLLAADEEDILKACTAQNWQLISKSLKNNWLCLHLHR